MPNGDVSDVEIEKQTIVSNTLEVEPLHEVPSSPGHLGGGEVAPSTDGLEPVAGHEVLHPVLGMVFDEASALPVDMSSGDPNRAVVVGVDDRLRIADTHSFPWRAICSLRILAADGTSWLGTGWMIGRRTLVTAGHCVYLHGHSGWARQIEVVPGRSGDDQPFGSCAATELWSVVGWMRDGEREYDYGAIVLPESFPIGDEIGTFGFAAFDSAGLVGGMANLAGYPGDKPVGTQWWHARALKEATAHTVTYDIDTAGGQSGAPVWRLVEGVRRAVAIHTSGFTTGNSGTRITEHVFNNLVTWREQGA